MSGPQDFAFVAGNAQDLPTRFGPSSAEILVAEVLPILTGHRRHQPVQLTALQQYGTYVTEYDVWTNPLTGAWRTTDRSDGDVDSYNPATHEYRLAGVLQEMHAGQWGFEPEVVQLALPLKLGVWGRDTDSWKMVSAAEAETELLVTLRSTRDDHLLGSLTVSKQHEMIIRFDTPAGSIHYRDIESSED